ncbi:formimidoylglutamase [Flavihumibacter profundi]|uniref:formimidoylglutamase n=1 Tax=Flavihumibacter profundi TaxID=2716883 RepID=UPI001CC6165C|nr:formimidoylglutamase [Flavihumibacter profundi]MBZ5857906.1 formimidoylglutamase [Flavihumibacter profundi]
MLISCTAKVVFPIINGIKQFNYYLAAMNDLQHLTDYLNPVSLSELSGDEGFRSGQIGKHIRIFEEDKFPDLAEADLVLVGCGEERGLGMGRPFSSAPDRIRHELFSCFFWHNDIQLADIGNIKAGESLADTYAALKIVIKELTEAGKTVLILGGAHDLTLAQYHAYADKKQIIEAACIDARIDLDMDALPQAEHFLMEILTGEPNFVKHYSHLAFQSYYVHPYMLENMDKLRFDCFRVGQIKEQIDEMEPVLRNCQLVSFDLSAIAHAYAPGSAISPNGLNGEEACVLARFAGMSPYVSSFGIYGYQPAADQQQLTAKQISQMIWYFIDGRSKGKREAPLKEKEAFFEYHTAFAEVDSVFLQSKKTGRWWMQLPDQRFIACSYKDYIIASNNDIPERWLRAQERN